jgi:hypothetical protein
MIFAIADAVRTDPTNHELLNNWKRCALSTTITFKNLETAEARMWHALQQRENASAVHLVVHRSCFQRCHELARLQSRLMETTSATDVAPQTLFNAYNPNLKMTPNAPGTVALNFVDNALTILNKLIGVPSKRGGFAGWPHGWDQQRVRLTFTIADHLEQAGLKH